MDVALTPQQYEFLTAEQKYCLFSGGLGSGKSFALCMWIIYQSQEYPDCIGLITNNTYRQLHDSTLTTLVNILDSNNIRFTFLPTKGEITINGTLIHCRSMENYNTLRGSEYGWWAADEAAFYKKEAWQVALGRIRDRRGSLQVKGATTPNGFNFLYEDFVLKPTDQHFLQHASSRDNPYLPMEYIHSLEQQYDEKLLEQEVEGKFVNLNSGRVYYSFNRDLHIREWTNPRAPNVYACDFNVNPITAVRGYIANDKIYITDEIYINDSNTYELADEIKKQWGLGSIVPDSTGKGRKTSAVKTDHMILKEAGLNVLYNPNPLVKDRYNTVNGLFKNNRLFISSKCKYLIKDLEQLVHENNDTMLSHISDALGYLCWKLFPLKTERPKNTNIPLRNELTPASQPSRSILNDHRR